MSIRKRPKKLASRVIAHLNELLDEALEETFPASDPVSINVEVGLSRYDITTAEEKSLVST